MFVDEYLVTLLISIHALREESDLARFSEISGKQLISIHALREESDETCSLQDISK